MADANGKLIEAEDEPEPTPTPTPTPRADYMREYRQGNKPTINLQRRIGHKVKSFKKKLTSTKQHVLNELFVKGCAELLEKYGHDPSKVDAGVCYGRLYEAFRDMQETVSRQQRELIKLREQANQPQTVPGEIYYPTEAEKKKAQADRIEARWWNLIHRSFREGLSEQNQSQIRDFQVKNKHDFNEAIEHLRPTFQQYREVIFNGYRPGLRAMHESKKEACLQRIRDFADGAAFTEYAHLHEQGPPTDEQTMEQLQETLHLMDSEVLADVKVRDRIEALETMLDDNAIQKADAAVKAAHDKLAKYDASYAARGVTDLSGDAEHQALFLEWENLNGELNSLREQETELARLRAMPLVTGQVAEYQPPQPECWQTQGYDHLGSYPVAESVESLENSEIGDYGDE